MVVVSAGMGSVPRSGTEIGSDKWASVGEGHLEAWATLSYILQVPTGVAAVRPELQQAGLLVTNPSRKPRVLRGSLICIDGRPFE